MPKNKKRRLWLIVPTLLLLGLAGWLVKTKAFAPPKPNHPPLMREVQIKGEEPVFKPMADVKMADNADVVGVIIKDQPYCFVLAQMKTFSTHVLNMHIEDTAVSVTYCDFYQCVRVLKKDNAEKPLEMGVGGMAAKTLVLIYEGERFSQEHEKIPLDDLDFERTTWAKWKEKHPNSLVYNGDTKSGNSD